MTLSEKSAYLKGLMEGMKLDTEANEGKLLAAIVDLLGDMAKTVSDVEETTLAISDELDEIVLITTFVKFQSYHTVMFHAVHQNCFQPRLCQLWNRWWSLVLSLQKPCQHAQIFRILAHSDQVRVWIQSKSIPLPTGRYFLNQKEIVKKSHCFSHHKSIRGALVYMKL